MTCSRLSNRWPSLPLRIRRWLVSLAMLAVAGVNVGCGGNVDTLGRQPVTGAVTLDGTPLVTGTIRFEPTEVPLKVKATSGGATISSGQYSISQAEGLPPGKYIVSIGSHGDESAQTLPSDPQAAMDAAAKLKPLVELIPARYNSQTELVIEVVKDDTKPINFDLKSGKK